MDTLIRRGDMVEEIATGDIGIVYDVKKEGPSAPYYKWVQLGTGAKRFTRAARVVLIHGTIHIDMRVYDFSVEGVEDSLYASWAKAEFEEGLDGDEDRDL